MVLSIDLNHFPDEIQQLEVNAAQSDLQNEHITIQENPGSFTSPIDADAIDDDVMLLPSSAWFSQAKYYSKRKRPITVVIDECALTNLEQSGVVEESITTVSLSVKKSRTKVPKEKIIIDCDLNANENFISKMTKGVIPNNADDWKEASAPPGLICPVCINTSKEPSTTICGHLFCRSCIETAISKQKKCPTCRKKLTKKNFHRIYLP